jgi:hypothetical protein
MVRGAQRLVKFRLVNTGGAETTAVLTNGEISWKPGKDWATSNVLFTVTVTDWSTSFPTVFFHAHEFVAEEPLVEVYPAEGQPGDVVLYGVPGVTCVVEQTTDPTGATGWVFVQTVTLANAFQRLEGLVPAGQTQFFRTRKL